MWLVSLIRHFSHTDSLTWAADSLIWDAAK